MATALVFAEVLDGKATDLTFELLDLARKLAGEDGNVTVVGIMPEGVATDFGAADRVLRVEGENEYVPERAGKALAAAMERVAPDVVLVGGSSAGMDAATYAACRTGTETIAYVRSVAPSPTGWEVESLILGGKMTAYCEAGRGVLLQVSAGAGNADRGRRPGAPPVEILTIDSGVQTRYLGMTVPEGSDVDIAKQDILVSIGRGIGDEANIEVAQELADILGAVVSASRPVVDAGWMPKSRQVGKSGKKVKPKVYLALGISGAPEHLEGMRDADCIIAVNTDPRAPIFDVAHYGVVEDLMEFVPALTELAASR